VQILDPTDERRPIRRRLAPRPTRLAGTIALLDISKPRGNVLLDRIAARLSATHADLSVRRYRKPTFARPAPEELRRDILRDCAYVIEALAD
jgi:hypothetical protein